MYRTFIAFFAGLFILSCSSSNQSTKSSNLIAIKGNPPIDSIVMMAANVVPTKRQYEWQKMEFTAFLHFGMNTFTGKEWGTGKENPQLFNPVDFNAKQWIKVIKSANMKMAMLTAKHHDGFCLWQTQTTEHSVKNSPWKNGKGDVLRELVEAAREENIKVGVYLSPADLHELERENGTYGNGSPRRLQKIPSNPELQKQADTVFSYVLDDYEALFMNQLYEVLTQYGEITEVWFDGANPKPGTGQTYTESSWYDMIRHLQPNAVIAIKGPDVRWVGNEAGKSRKNEWSVLPFSCKPIDCDWADATAEDLGSREQLKNAKYLYWYPAETDTPIRAGWFYRDEQQYVRTVEELLDIWYRSVGNNTVLLLNISPDRRGQIPDKDADHMAKLGQLLQQSFDKNIIENAKITVQGEVEGQYLSATNREKLSQKKELKEGKTNPKITITLDSPQSFNRFVLQEDIQNYGQRIEEFCLGVREDDTWKEIYRGGTVGYKKIARFPMQYTDAIQLEIVKARKNPSVDFLGVYKAPEMLSAPIISRNKQGKVTIRCKTPDPVIYYTLDGSNPTTNSLKYSEEISLPEGGLVKAIAVIANGLKKSEVAVKSYDICQEKWKAVGDIEVKGFEVEKAIDGDEKTMWHTPWEDSSFRFPHSLQIDLGEELTIKGITYLSRQDVNKAGTCVAYRIEGSLDGKNWKVLSKGSFANIENNPVKQEVRFPQREVRYIKFVALKSIKNQHFLSVAEIGVLTR